MFRTVFFCLVAAGLFSSVAHAQGENRYSFSANLKYGVYYMPNCWTTVNVDLGNNTDRDVDGYIQMPLSAAGAPAEVRRRVFVPARSKVRATVWAYFPDIEIPTGKKGVAAPELTIATWRSADGSQLGRCPILGQSTFRKHSQTGDTPSPMGAGAMLISSGRDDAPDTADAVSLADSLNRQLDYVATNAQALVTEFPSHLAGYSQVRAIVFDQVNPDLVDPVQREALLEHIRSGAQLIISAPTLNCGLAESWLAPYLPVQLIGERQIKQIQGKGQKPIPLTDWCDSTEATFREGTLVLGDEHFVHVAWKPLGLGRVIFTSFPANALDLKKPDAQQLWRSMLGPVHPSFDLMETKLVDQQEAILKQIVGLKTPPWKTAAGLASGYLALVVLVQLVWRGPTRPRAFGVLAVAAVLYSLGLVSMNLFARRSQPLMQATVGLIDIANGGGRQVQYTAYFGQDVDDLSLTSSEPQATIRPILSSPESVPTIEQGPWAIPDAAAVEQRIDRIWEAVAPAPKDLTVDAAIRFNEEGATIHVDHNLKRPLDSGLLLWGDEIVRLPAMATGTDARLTTDLVNPPGDFVNSAVLTSEGARVRGNLIASMYTRQSPPTTVRASYESPHVVAWVNDVPSMLEPSTAPGDVRREILLRAPIRIEPAAPNTTVRVDAPFVAMVSSNDLTSPRLVPMSLMAGAWRDSNQPNIFYIGFHAPRQIGRTRPVRFTLETDLNAPAYTVTFHRGQVSKGKAQHNASGPVVASYRNTFGRQDPVTVECGDEDVDANGVLWLLLSITRTNATETTQVPAKWSLRQVRVSLDANVLPPSDQ